MGPDGAAPRAGGRQRPAAGQHCEGRYRRLLQAANLAPPQIHLLLLVKSTRCSPTPKRKIEGRLVPVPLHRALVILEMNSEDEAEEDGANIDLDSQRKGKCVVLKTSMRQVLITTTAVFVLICAADKVPEESLMKTIEVDRLIDMVSDANPRELIDEKIHWMHVDMTKGGPLHVSEQ
ncbi:uncharacterized protein LOC120655540 isoform X3 [Panicum virgatum]|uniref:uncharacterized protein LOC120655540 isoform X3 n=1 Tax=Panicum virgatum TaxID=38727 RepID=UPI0019D64FE9|nr:uncharacterized protein LOC120655540 isoform X3 [Panicum virgatum]